MSPSITISWPTYHHRFTIILKVIIHILFFLKSNLIKIWFKIYDNLEVNCRHSILHPWFNQGRLLEWPSIYKKKKSFLHHMHHFVFASHASICSCIVCINLFITYHKNDFDILMVATVFPISKSNHRIKRYRMINFTRSICIVLR